MRLSRLFSIATLLAASQLAAQEAPASDWPVAEGSRVRIRSSIFGDWGTARRARYAVGSPEGAFRERSLSAGGFLGALVGAPIGAWMGRRPVDTWVEIKIPKR